MSKKHKYYPHTGPNLYIMIILILIVLQWFRVGTPAVPGLEGNLTCNGGLFIITMFMLVACSCEREVYYKKPHCHHH